MTFATKVKCTCKIGTIYDVIKKCILTNAFFKPQFNYCPQFECVAFALCIVYSNKKLNFEELLERDDSVSIHHQNIRFLAFKIIKVFKDLNIQHCVKSVLIRSFFEVSLRIQSECGKIPTRKTPYLDTFHAVQIVKEIFQFRSLNCYTD